MLGGKKDSGTNRVAKYHPGLMVALYVRAAIDIEHLHRLVSVFIAYILGSRQVRKAILKSWLTTTVLRLVYMENAAGQGLPYSLMRMAEMK